MSWEDILKNLANEENKLLIGLLEFTKENYNEEAMFLLQDFITKLNGLDYKNGGKFDDDVLHDAAYNS